jgi:hypothetical protein
MRGPKNPTIVGIKMAFFLTFPAFFYNPIFFSNFNSNYFSLADMKNLQEQFKHLANLCQIYAIDAEMRGPKNPTIVGIKMAFF